MKQISKQIIQNSIIALFIIILSFSNITEYINPFIYPFCISLVSNGFNVYLVIFAFCAGLLLNSISLSSLFLIINMCAVLALVKLFNSIKKTAKIKWINYIFVILSQIALIYNNLFSKTAIISVCVSIIASLLFYYIYQIFIKSVQTKKINGNYVLDEKICIFISCVSILLGLSSINIGGLFIIYFICALCLLISSQIFLDIQTLIVACAFCLSVALSNNSILPFAIILIWGIVIIVLSKINRFVMAIGLVTVDIFLGCVFNAYIRYNYINLLTVLIPAIIVMIIPDKIFCKFEYLFAKKQQNIAKNYILTQNCVQIKNKLNNLSRLFCDLSSCYKSLLSSNISKEKFASFIAQEVQNNFCDKCGINCDKSEIQSKIIDLVNIAIIKNRITVADLPNNFYVGCPLINQMLSLINEGVKEFNTLNNKTTEQNETLVALTQNCSGAGSVINQMSKSFSDYKVSAKIKCTDIIAEFGVYNLYIKDVAVLENEKDELSKVILIVRAKDAGALAFGEVLSRVLKCKMMLTKNEATNISGWNALTYEIAVNFKVFLGYANRAKQTQSGDNILFSKLSNNTTVLALCDGMGTGETASKKSNLCLDLLLNYLKIGIDKGVVINSINNLLLKTNSKNFSTLDMAEINLFNGRVDFIKLASAVSFIKRKNTCQIIEGQGLPMGIVDCVYPSTKTEYVTGGDFIIICSDGVVDSFGEEALRDYINNERTINAQILAESILEEALNRARTLDDMTCCVLKINNY